MASIIRLTLHQTNCFTQCVYCMNNETFRNALILFMNQCLKQKLNLLFIGNDSKNILFFKSSNLPFHYCQSEVSTQCARFKLNLKILKTKQKTWLWSDFELSKSMQSIFCLFDQINRLCGVLRMIFEMNIIELENYFWFEWDRRCVIDLCNVKCHSIKYEIWGFHNCFAIEMMCNN